MPIIALFAFLWVVFVIIVLAALSGWLINILYALWVVGGALVDVACQAWIDISKLWRRKAKVIKLDEYEQRISG